MWVGLQAFLTTAWIMQPRAENGGRIEVNNQHILFKFSGTCDERPLFVKDHAAAVEHQFILSTNHVEIDDNQAVIGITGRQNFLEEYPLNGIIGRHINVYVHI